MTGFRDQAITWKGATYTIPARGIMPLVAEVEDILRGTSGLSAAQVLLSNRPSISRVAMCYGAMLRFAGAGVSDEEVYLSIQSDLAEGSSEYLAAYTRATALLLEIVSPPMADKMAELMAGAEGAGDDAEKKPGAAA